MKRLFGATLFVVVGGCTSTVSLQTTHTDFSAFKHTGSAVNYTAQIKREYEGDIEVSSESDVRYKGDITDYGESIRFQDRLTVIDFKQSTLPSFAHSSWDGYFVGTMHVARNIVDFKLDASETKEVELDIRLPIRVNSEGYPVVTNGQGDQLFSVRAQLPEKAIGNWDDLFYTEDKRYGLYYNRETLVYRLLFNKGKGWHRRIDFFPQHTMFRSTSNGYYRHVIHDYGGAYAYDYLPTQNFICADLTKQHASIRANQGVDMAAGVLLSIVQAYVGDTVTTHYGTSQSHYNGVYSKNRNHVSWSGYGTTSYSGYSKTYDYTHIGDTAKLALDEAFSAGDDIDAVETAMRLNSCVM